MNGKGTLISRYPPRYNYAVRQLIRAVVVSSFFISSALIAISPANAAACSGTTGTSGSYTLMQFTAAQSGCTWSIPAGVSAVDVLIVGGGGGAGFGNLGGGGGAGQVLASKSAFSVVPGDAVTLTVGNYGAGGYNDNSGSWNYGSDGSPSSVTINSSTYSATGGGSGGGNNRANGNNGGSGGGSAMNGTGGSVSANSYLQFNSYGNIGASGSSSGGGGAGGVGSGSTGGAGISLWGLNFAGGGGGWGNGYGGGSASATNIYGAGSAGGGYASGSGVGTSATNHGQYGADGTGSGGGGGEHGGTGLVVFRYLVDSVAPTFSSAAVANDGVTLAVTFSETISATTAPTSHWSVSANGTVDTVTAVSVSGSIVTLTLQVQVTAALLIKVSYTDPTAGNDANAVQDLGLNDAASFTNQSVTNNSSSKTAVTISMTLSGNGYNATYRALSTLTITTNAPGKVRFTMRGKAIPGCQNIAATSVSTYYQATCSWRPSVHNGTTVAAQITSSNSNFQGTPSVNLPVLVGTRSGTR